MPDKRPIGDLLGEAVDLSAGERSAWLAELARSRPTAAAEVAELLASHDEAERQGFLGGGPNAFLSGASVPPIRDEETRADPIDSSEELTAWASTELQDELPASGPQGGALIDGDYELLDQIGRGGMGVVYRARQLSLNRMVALKLIPQRMAVGEEQVARFYVEAEAAGGLDHPGIVPVLGVGEDSGVHFYAMALVEGGSLASHVHPARRLPPARTARLIEKTALAVQHAHDRAVIHRDIKPANVLIDVDGEPRLTDFGLAKLADADELLTTTGVVMGTPSYMPPEQAEGKNREVSTRSDIYSLGATLYALLAGRPPFTGESALNTLEKVRSASPAALPRDVPTDLRIICETCLAKAPDQRYANANALAADLRAYLEGYPIVARRVGPWRRGVAWARRNPIYASLIGTVMLTLAIATVVSTRFGLEARRQARLAEENAQTLGNAIEDTFLFASDEVLAESPGMQRGRGQLLRSAEGYYLRLLDSGGSDSTELAATRFRLGRVLGSRDRLDEAELVLTQARDSQAQLLREAPQDPMRLARLAATHNELARLGKKRWKRAAADSPERAVIFAAWRSAADTTRRLRERLLAVDPNEPETQRLLANAESNYGVVLGLDNSADRQEARRWIEAAQERRLRLLAAQPDNADLLSDLAVGWEALSDVVLGEAGLDRVDQGTPEMITKVLGFAQSAQQVIERIPPADRSAQDAWRLAQCQRLVGECHLASGDPRAAADICERRWRGMHRLARRYPSVGEFQIGLGNAWFDLAVARLTLSDPTGYEAFDQAIDTLAEAFEVDPTNEATLDRLAECAEQMARGLAASGLSKTAVERLAGASSRLRSRSETWEGPAMSRERLENVADRLDAFAESLTDAQRSRTL